MRDTSEENFYFLRILLPWKWEVILNIETDTKENRKWERKGKKEAKEVAESYDGREYGEVRDWTAKRWR